MKGNLDSSTATAALPIDPDHGASDQNAERWHVSRLIHNA
jgi:hypothetical protein